MSTTITIRSSLLREALACSCGCFKPHAFATRETADGKRVRLWTDGTITHAGVGDPFIKGLGEARSTWGTRARSRTLRLIANDVSLFDLAELPTLVRVGEPTGRSSWSSENDRRLFIILDANRRLRKAG